MKISIYPDDVLRKKSIKVEPFDAETRSQLLEMHSAILNHDGVGLAAPQVGILKRMFVVDLHDGAGPLFFVNPEVRDLKAGTSSATEGCLSVPGAWGAVARPSCVIVRYEAFDGRRSEKTFSGLMARVVQHETDHLDGIILLDRMESYVKRAVLEGVWEARVKSRNQP